MQIGLNDRMSELTEHSSKPTDRPDRKNLGRASLLALFWSGIEQWGGQVFSLAFYVLLARLLGPNDFGIVAMAGVYVAFVQLFVNQGLAMALVQRNDLQSNHLNSAFWTSVILGVALAIASCYFSDEVAMIYKQPELGNVIQALSITLIFTSLSGVHTALLKRRLQFKPLAIRTLVATLLGGFVGVAMAFSGYGIWSLVGQQLVSSCVRMLLLWIQSDWRPSFQFSFSALREIMPFSLNILGANLVEFGNRYSDKFIIGLYLGPAALGLYVVAYKLYRTLTILLAGFIGQVAVSSFSAMQNEPEKLRKAFYRVTRLASFVSFPVFAMTAAIAMIAFPLLLGDDWEQSAPVFMVLAIAGALECVFLFNANLMIALGKPHWRFRMGTLNAVLNIAGFYFAVNYGIFYVALAYVLRTILVSPLPIYLVKLLIDIKPSEYIKGFSVPFVGVATICIASAFLSSFAEILENSYVLLFVFVSACSAFYLLITYLMNKPVVMDLMHMKKYIKAR